MPDYNSLRQLMGGGFLPQSGAQAYPDFAQQGTPSGGTMQPMPPSGGYGGWGQSSDVLDANQLAGVGAGWNPQAEQMQPWQQPYGSRPQPMPFPGAWGTQMPYQQPQQTAPYNPFQPWGRLMR